MPIYKYSAVDKSGKYVKKMLRADNVTALSQRLRENDMFLVEQREADDSEIKKFKMRPREMSDYARQISTMMGSGVPLVRAINIMAMGDGRPGYKKLLQNIYNLLQQGNSLSEAMEMQNGAFPELMINMFRVGEASGSLDKTAARVAVHYEKDHKMKNKIKSAMTYPKILGGLTIVVILFIFSYILPLFMEILKDMPLPTATKIVLWISNTLKSYWIFIIIGMLCIILAVSTALKIPKVRYILDAFKLRIPRIGKLLRTIYTARFSRTLNTLYTSGISIVNALDIVAGTVGNDYIRVNLASAIAEVRNGEPLSASLSKIDGFLPNLRQIIEIGEETGRLDEMLDSTADAFDYDAEMALGRLVAIVEPLMIVIMALLIGFVIISVLQPILMMYNSIA